MSAASALAAARSCSAAPPCGSCWRPRERPCARADSRPSIAAPWPRALRLGLPERIARAGLEGRVSLAAVLAAKARRRARLAAGRAAALAPAAPGRLSLLVAVAIPAAGFLAPDALLERSARRRRAGPRRPARRARPARGQRRPRPRPPRPASRSSPRRAAGPSAEELSVAVAEISCGLPQREALRLAAAPRPGPRAGGALRRDRALAPLRLAAGRAAPAPGRGAAPRSAPRGRGARCPGRAEDPARRRPRPGPLGAADDRRRG